MNLSVFGKIAKTSKIKAANVTLEQKQKAGYQQNRDKKS